MSKLSYQKFIQKKPWYESWKSAKRRCNDTKHKSYRWYGGRGIIFILKMDECEFIWKRDKAHLMKNPQLDRKNNNRGYSLPNCRFIERLENIMRSRIIKEPEKTEWED